MVKQQLHSKRHDIIIILAVTFLLSNGYLFAQEQYNIEKDYFILPLKYISVQTGMKFLGDAKVDCTYTNVPGSATIVVRSRQKQERDKAKVILNLVDAQVQYAIETTQPEFIPSNEEIIAKVGNISIGSFTNPPSRSGPKLIVDVHNDSVIVIAPKFLIEKIVSTITQISNEKKEQFTQFTEPVKQELIPTTVTQEKEPNIVPALFAQNVDKKTPGKSISDERITAPIEKEIEPVNKTISEQPTQLETVPELFAATQASEPLPLLNPDDEIVLNLEGKLTLIELLGFIGPYLQMNFIYNEADLANKDITFSPNGTLKGPIKIRDAYDILEEIFRLKDLIMTRGKGNIVTILPIANVLDGDPDIIEADGEAEFGDTVVTSLFKIKHIDLASAQNLLNGRKLTTNITPLEQTKTLIVTGYSSRMPHIKELLEIVDKPGEPKEFRFRQLVYTSANTLSPKIKTLAEQLGTISITVTQTSVPDVPTTIAPRDPSRETAAEYTRRVQLERAAIQAAARTQAAIQQPSTSEPTVYLDADERTNRILMIGLKEQLDEVEQLIGTLDVARQDLRTLQSYKIENLDAEDVRAKLQELNIIGESSEPILSPRISSDEKQAATQAALIRTDTSASDAAASSVLAEEPKVVVIEPTNTLLVHATAEQHINIASIINFVDRAIEDEEMPYKMYKLKNTSPEHVFSVIEPLIQETIQDAEGRIERVQFNQDERITIVSDPNTSSLIVNANKKNQEWIGDLIMKLDKRRPQVLIDVTLVQISKTDLFDYDLNILSSFPDLTDTSGLTSALLPVTEGSTNLVESLMDSPRGHFVDFQTGGGTGAGFFADKHINALLTAMQQKDYGRVLATPKILVNDNQRGEIISTDVTYVTRTSSIPVSSGTAGQETNLIQTETDYEPYDAGITLMITPHISESDLLRLDIELERSDFGTITGEKPPDTTVSNIKTNVTVPDGSTIILGGLQKLNQSKGGTKVPLLGDLPLVGGAFRSVSNSDIQRNLYVFVKAEVIRPPEDGVAQVDLERISDINRKAFEKQEREFQKYESWPGIISEPMKPWKVLETQ